MKSWYVAVATSQRHPKITLRMHTTITTTTTNNNNNNQNNSDDNNNSSSTTATANNNHGGTRPLPRVSCQNVPN